MLHKKYMNTKKTLKTYLKSKKKIYPLLNLNIKRKLINLK